MKPKLSDRSVRYMMRQISKGKSTKTVAEELHVSQRHVQRLWAEYNKAGTAHIQRHTGRPKDDGPTSEEIRTVLDAYDSKPQGVVRTAKNLRKSGCNISHPRIYKIMKSNGLVVASPAKAKRRKWVRCERLYSNAMWHTDWHMMKDPRLKGLNLITYLDDSSRCVTGAALFEDATSVNAVVVLRQAISRFGTPATILSDNGSCFVGRGGRKKSTGRWTPAAFESEIQNRNIELINSRPHHPQTNGKIERFHRSLEEEIGNNPTLDDYIEYYNTDRLHFSLDIDSYETPLMAFRNRKATNLTRRQNPKWMEEDINAMPREEVT